MLPLDNKPEFSVVLDMPEGTALPVTANLAHRMAEKLRTLPEVTAIQLYAGTARPFDFNGMVRHYYLRSDPWQGELQVQLAAQEEAAPHQSRPGGRGPRDAQGRDRRHRGHGLGGGDAPGPAGPPVGGGRDPWPVGRGAPAVRPRHDGALPQGREQPRRGQLSARRLRLLALRRGYREGGAPRHLRGRHQPQPRHGPWAGPSSATSSRRPATRRSISCSRSRWRSARRSSVWATCPSSPRRGRRCRCASWEPGSGSRRKTSSTARTCAPWSMWWRTSAATWPRRSMPCSRSRT